MTSELGGSVTAPNRRTRALLRAGSRCRRRMRRSLRICSACRASTRGRGRPSRLGRPGTPQREDDHGRVVDVGVVLVRELEREAARRKPGPAHCPVAPRPHLLARQPFACPDDCLVLGIDACVEQCEHRQRRIPDGRLAGLEAAALVVLDREVVETVDRPSENRVVEGVAERMQRDDDQTHGGWIRPRSRCAPAARRSSAPLSSEPAFAAGRPAGRA